MTVHHTRQGGLWFVLLAMFTIGAREASAQTYQFSMYVGGNGYFEGELNVYVDVADQTDMSCCPGAYHYNYYSLGSVSASSGSDSDEGWGLGTWGMTIPWADDGGELEGEIIAGVAFECSIGGPLGGSLPAQPIRQYPFRYRYEYSQQVGVDTFRYIPSHPGNNRCKPSIVYHWQQYPDLTLYGHETLIGDESGPRFCGGKCSLGWSGPENPRYGSGGSQFYCPPTGSDNF